MSQLEFDTYLSLLCRLLRIAPQQREQVAEEFRAHMEDRLDELLAKGMQREAAVKLALEEFGDAAGLAAQIASISQGRRKRWIMRIGTVSVVGLAAAGLLAVALWPDGANVKVPQVVAQTGEGSGGKTVKGQPAKSLEAKLSQRFDSEYTETPLMEVLSDLQERVDIQIYVNRKAIMEANNEKSPLDAPITIRLKQVRLDTILDLVLEQAGGSDALAYVERDGILIVANSEALSGASEVKVYNCRDLLAMTSPTATGGMMMGPGMMMPGGGPGIPGAHGGGGLPGTPGPSGFEPDTRSPKSGEDSDLPGGLPPGAAGPKAPTRTRTKDGPSAGGADASEIPKGVQPQFGGGGGAPGATGGAPMGGAGMMGGGMGMQPGVPMSEEEQRAARLMNLITTAVKTDSWQDMGGFGTISEYKGLIVVSHNARTHKEVENVLKMLREAAGLPPGGPVGGMMLPGPMPGGGPTRSQY
jgi:hypothetical protein